VPRGGSVRAVRVEGEQVGGVAAGELAQRAVDAGEATIVLDRHANRGAVEDALEERIGRVLRGLGAGRFGLGAGGAGLGANGIGLRASLTAAADQRAPTPHPGSSCAGLSAERPAG